MLRAILSGTKTQTRRVVKPQPATDHDGEPYWFIGGYRAWRHRVVTDVLRMGTNNELSCPYGQPDDRLWVRDESRITLEIVSVRVERLQEISEEDALAEGVATVVRESLPQIQQCGEYDVIDADPVEVYRDLWDQIHGPGSWDANPWVWVIKFKRVI